MAKVNISSFVTFGNEIFIFVKIKLRYIYNSTIFTFSMIFFTTAVYINFNQLFLPKVRKYALGKIYLRFPRCFYVCMKDQSMIEAHIFFVKNQEIGPHEIYYEILTYQKNCSYFATYETLMKNNSDTTVDLKS